MLLDRDRLVDHVLGVGDRVDPDVGRVGDGGPVGELGGELDGGQDVDRRVGRQAGDHGVAEEDPVRDVAGDAGGDEPDAERPGVALADVLDHGADLELLAPGRASSARPRRWPGPGRAGGPWGVPASGPGEIPIGPWSSPAPLVGDRG